jgi:hypothetical protein
MTNEQIRQAQLRYDVILLIENHMNLLTAVLNMDNYRIAAAEPLGSNQFVLLKYASKEQQPDTSCGNYYKGTSFLFARILSSASISSGKRMEIDSSDGFNLGKEALVNLRVSK